ncbi:MAG: hypothetical protein GY940_37870 [bacterium]|nr:hypothetical protein [bacterium]
MKNTLAPEIIYDAFSRHDLALLRIDHFDRGNYAEIRMEINHTEPLTIDQLLELTAKLRLIEKNENIKIKIVHLDMFHKTLRINIETLDPAGSQPGPVE